MLELIINFLRENAIELLIGVPIVGLLLAMLKQAVKLIDMVLVALEDNKLTKQEIIEIKNQAKKLAKAWNLLVNGVKGLFSKKPIVIKKNRGGIDTDPE